MMSQNISIKLAAPFSFPASVCLCTVGSVLRCCMQYVLGGRTTWRSPSQGKITADHTDFYISSYRSSGYSINIRSHHRNVGGIYHVIYLLKYPLASSSLSAFLFLFSLDYMCVVVESYVVCAAPSTKPVLSSRE